MKMFLTGLGILFIFVIAFPLIADAQTCRRGGYSGRRDSNRNVSRSNYGNNYGNRGGNRYNYENSNRDGYGNGGYRTYSTRGDGYNRPNFYERHRNAINMGIGTGSGAIIGGIVGGRKGAVIGTAIGAGGGALYTYVLNKKRPRYYRR